MPVMPPLTEPAVPMLLLPLVHVPPVSASVSSVVLSTHTFSIPDMAAGKGFTVNTVALIQPVAVSLYVMLEVPAMAPYTIPVPAPITALPLSLLQVPRAVLSLRLVLNVKHICVAPVMMDGKGFTVTTVVMIQPVGSV